MDMDNGVGIDCGWGGRLGGGGQEGEGWDNCNSINTKIFNIKRIYLWLQSTNDYFKLNV